MAYFALVPAAGSGSRMSAGLSRPMPKQYLPLAGHPLIFHALAALAAVEAIARVFVVLAPDDTEWQRHDWSTLQGRIEVLSCGGETRAASVANGLHAMAGQVQSDDWILVHDAARPCVTPAQVETLIRAVDDQGGEADKKIGGILAMPLADTLKCADSSGCIEATVPRDGLWQAQTPQMFRHGKLLEALSLAPDVTDEAGAIEALGLRPKLVAADATNFKVTWPLDLDMAELILRHREKNK